MKTLDNLKPIPEVGKFYHFWDDGKTSSSRHYICRVEELIKTKDAKNIMVGISEWDFENKKEILVAKSLYDHWKFQVKNHDWLYADETDYFVRISCPHYDEYDLYAVRTKYGGWFTLDIQSWCGELDVDGKKYERVMEDYYDGQYDWDSIYVEAIEENWKK